MSFEKIMGDEALINMTSSSSGVRTNNDIFRLVTLIELCQFLVKTGLGIKTVFSKSSCELFHAFGTVYCLPFPARNSRDG